MQYKFLWKHSSMPIKWSAGSSVDRLPAMFSTKRQMTGFDVVVGFCYWSWRFIFLHQISSQMDVTQAYKNTFFFLPDFIPKICFCCTFKLHLADQFGISNSPTRYRVGRGQSPLGVNWSPSGNYKALVRRDHCLLSGPQAWGWHSSLSFPPSL